jgi:hypothetical protein
MEIQEEYENINLKKKSRTCCLEEMCKVMEGKRQK